MNPAVITRMAVNMLTACLRAVDRYPRIWAKPCAPAGVRKPLETLLFALDHPHIALGQVVVKRDREVVHEGQGLGLEIPQPIQQVQRRGLRRAATFVGPVEAKLQFDDI